ncbi:MAG: methyltransferase domain-containing protein [Rhodospirillaceae bacterium]|nr:methyltransferase domain-containing protein [Rhodospirillaceae bacterium]
MKTFLHIGCGDERRKKTPFAQVGEDWRETSLDVDPASRPDILGPMTSLAGAAAKGFDAVYASHSFESLYPHEVPVALAEFKRVLKPEGFVLIVCRDQQAEGKASNPAPVSSLGGMTPMNITVGLQPVLAGRATFTTRRIGYTQETLSAELTRAGFALGAAGRRTAPYNELWVIAFVSPQSEAVLRAAAVAYFPD